MFVCYCDFVCFVKATATTEIYTYGHTLSLHDALPISNDLTQTTLGISRDDAALFMEDYLKAGIFERDPFVTIDQAGVGELITLATQRGRSVRKDIKLGICGEHGGDPSSVRFCHNAGLDYVSCSPYRVPIARLAAAQAAISDEKASEA